MFVNLEDKVFTNLSSRLTNIKSSFDELGQTELKKTEKEFTQLFGKITKKLGDLGTEVEKAKEGLTALWHETKKGEYYRPKTLWFVPGRKGILAFFQDMVSRAKQQVMLAAPTIQDIDIEMIKNLPGRVNVRIATSVDMGVPSDRQAYGVLSEIGNVTVRQYEPKDFWGVMVDAREALLAAIPAENTEEFNGIACIADEYNIVFRRLLADVWLSAERIK